MRWINSSKLHNKYHHNEYIGNKYFIIGWPIMVKIVVYDC